MLPTKKECIKLVKEKNPPNILIHSKKVEQVSNAMAKIFLKKGLKIDKKLVSRAALLHDIDKWGQIQHGFEYRAGEKMLEKKWPSIWKIVKKTHLTAVLNNEHETWEEKIVFYCDKRVNPDDKFVSLKKRFEYIENKYGKNAERLEEIKKAEKKSIQMEKEIFKILKIKPEEFTV